MPKDESTLEERLFRLKESYKQPFSEAENKPDNGSVSGFVGSLLGLVTAGMLAVGSFLVYQHFRTPNLNPTPLPASQVVMEGPFRQHYAEAIGSGSLMNVTYSDGMADFDEAWLATYHYRLQRIRPEENPDGCGVSVYNTDKIWFGSEPNTITVNGVPIAENYVPTGSHGYIFEYPLNIGDKICVTHVPQSGYHIYFGPDLYWHYDSYCYRGHCQGAQ